MKYKCLFLMVILLAGTCVYDAQCIDDRSASKTHVSLRKRTQKTNKKYVKILLSALVGTLLLDMLYTKYSQYREFQEFQRESEVDQNIYLQKRKEEVKDGKVLENQQNAACEDYKSLLLAGTPLSQDCIAIVLDYVGPCMEGKDATISRVKLGMRDNRPIILFQDNNGIISIVDAQKDGQLCHVACSPHFEPSFSRNGKLFCTYDDVFHAYDTKTDPTFHAYDTQTGKKIQSYRENQNIVASLFVRKEPSNVRMVFAKNDALVVTHADKKTILWSTKRGTRLRTIEASLPSFTINDHETKLLVMLRSGRLQGNTRELAVVDLKTCKPETIAIPCRARQSLDAILTPSGNELVVSVTNKDTYDIFNTEGRLVRSIPRVGARHVPIKALCNEANNRLIIHSTLSDQPELTLYDCDAKEPVIYSTRSTTPSDIARSVQLDRTKKRCLFGAVRYPYQIVDVENGTLVHPIERENSSERDLVTIVRGDAKSGGRASSFNERVKQVSAHWGPGDKTIITTDWTGDMCIYDAKTHALIKKCPDAGHWLMQSPCKQWILMRNQSNNTVTVWHWPELVQHSSQKSKLIAQS